MNTAALQSMETIEPRIAPATAVNAHLVTYADADGENLTIAIGEGVLTAADLSFNNAFGAAGAQQLAAIGFFGDADKARAHITLTATRSAAAGGDGLAHGGFLDGTGIHLGVITMDGDLGRIACVGGAAIPLNAGPHDGLEAHLGITGDFAVREVGL